MKEQIQKIRVALHARTLDLAQLGQSRALSLAMTTCEQARMLLGECLRCRGEITPYPHSDDPASQVISPAQDVAGMAYLPSLPEGEVAATKEVRRRLAETVDELTALRRQIWARDYGQVEEVIYDRALSEIILTRNWLGIHLVQPVAAAATKPARSATIRKIPAAKGA